MKQLLESLESIKSKYGLFQGFDISLRYKFYEVAVVSRPYIENDEPGKFILEIVIRDLLKSKRYLFFSEPELQREELVIIPDDLRKKILDGCTRFMEKYVNITPYERRTLLKEEVQERLDISQDMVEKEYAIKLGVKQFVQKKVGDRVITTRSDEIMKLHMFFSPNRVVRGLTADEARLCISLYPARMQQVRLAGGMYPPSLHRSLFEGDINGASISRTEGLKNAIFEIFMDLANWEKWKIEANS